MLSREVALLFGSAMSLCSCSTMAVPKDTVVAHATLVGSDGAPHGTATVSASADRLTLRVDATQLTAGTHGIHLHAVGKCEGPQFTTAGPHLNPYGKMHGTMNPQGSHLGDLPNLVIGADGHGSLIIPLDGSSASLEPLLFDSDGTALVVHASPDDYVTDPSGNSGGRIVCGALVSGKA